MRKVLEYLAVGVTGGVLYTVVEILWRGYSHWTMAITGGMCLVFIYMSEARHHFAPLWKRCLADCLIITLAELVVGFVVNMLLDLGVWDYSRQFMNLFGQVCLLYSCFWYLMGIPAAYLCAYLRKLFRKGHRDIFQAI